MPLGLVTVAVSGGGDSTASTGKSVARIAETVSSDAASRATRMESARSSWERFVASRYKSACLSQKKTCKMFKLVRRLRAELLPPSFPTVTS